MSIAEAALTAGQFLLEHVDLIDDIAKALAGGATKDAIKAAIRGVQEEVSRAALIEELDAAEARK